MTGDRARVSIVYDSVAVQGFETGWGFSALIYTSDSKILFDCGWDGHMLTRNLARLGVHAAAIDKVVLSHMHWDHISGLTELLSQSTPAKPIEVYLPKAFSDNLKREVVKHAIVTEVEGACEIASGVSSTGSLGSEIKEQSLVVRSGEKAAVLTGCAHPGLRDIMARASEIVRPTALIGGLHGARADDVPKELERLVLCHCTQAKAELLKEFGERASVGLVGASYTV